MRKPAPNEVLQMKTYRLLVVSDVHGRLAPLRWILKQETADAMFFLGDGLFDLDGAVNLLRDPLPYPVYRVRGNCDVGFPDPLEGLVPVGGVLFFYTHGHNYFVKSSYEELTQAARNRGADVALFGHSHHRSLVYNGIPDTPTLFNPGSLRDEGIYGVITVEDGRCNFEWKVVPC